ncbi:6917_t:CDS:2 [Entrophospora sp. SA101]|nr:6917_t:CDS:2 [Entrophospora sp. SA101]
MTEIADNNSSSPTTPHITLSHDGSTQDIYVSSTAAAATSSPKRRSLNNSVSVTQLKKQLLEQFNEQADQIQMTAELGAALVKQQAELEQRINELNQTEGDEVPLELKNKLDELEREAKNLDANTAKVFLGAKGSSQNDTPAVTASSRRRDMSRQKGRTKDIEFATEIGQGLLVEVRRLQALLQEKEERIKELETDKSELERNIELLNKQLRAKEENEEQYKEENWNLELSRQDLNSQVIELQSQFTKSHSDYQKLERALAIATDVIEQLKDKEEVLTNNFETLKNRHDQDMANNRRHISAVNREKNDMSKTIEELKSKLDNLMVARSLRNKRNPDQKNSIHKSLMGKNLNIELETLKALNISNRMVGNLRANLQKEKSEKYELKKLLAESQELIEMMRYETEFHDPTSINSGMFKNRRSSSRFKRSSSASNRSVRNHETLMEEGFGDNGVVNGVYGADDDQSMIFPNGANGEMGYDDINKNNRPSSDMFRPHGWKSGVKSRGSVRSSIMSSRIDEDIVPGESDEEYDTKDGEVAAARAEALNNLTKSDEQFTTSQSSRSSRSSRFSRISRQILSEEPDSIVEILSNESQSIRDSNSRDSIVRKRISEYDDISKQIIDSVDKEGNPKLYLDDDNDDVSSVDSFASANEPDDIEFGSKRASTNSRRESKKFSKRESSISPLLNKKHSIIIPEEALPPLPKKVFRDISVQTDKVIEPVPTISTSSKTDSMCTFNTGKFTFGERDTMAYENSKSDVSSIRQSNQLNDNTSNNSRTNSINSMIGNNNDKNRFTLDLSSPANKSQNNNNQPKRPLTVSFGQQAGSPQLPNHPLQDSDNSKQNDSNSNNNNNVNDPNTLHQRSPSSDSISTVSTTSTSSDQKRRSDASYMDTNGTSPIVGPTPGTDPTIIHAITQTMIGEYLWKYTRRNFGAGISEKRHKRFFWVHPYTKTLYWSSKDPGNNEPIDPKIKSGMSYFAYIESVRQVVDHNPSPPGLHHMSLIIKTPERELKFTAQSKERHEYWFQALNYLLQRPEDSMQNEAWDGQSDARNLNINNSNQNGDNNIREIKKKSSFSKLQSIFRRDGTGTGAAAYSQCCDGKHDIGKLEHHKHF